MSKTPTTTSSASSHSTNVTSDTDFTTRTFHFLFYLSLQPILWVQQASPSLTPSVDNYNANKHHSKPYLPYSSSSFTTTTTHLPSTSHYSPLFPPYAPPGPLIPHHAVIKLNHNPSPTRTASHHPPPEPLDRPPGYLHAHKRIPHPSARVPTLPNKRHLHQHRLV
ncbi:hypothetical protein K458DRAFT_383652 [Lentithecium fluviatile CBS 122367]|uniref:Uncharacterized protein n=1 Tax=Lentithecium fluviatile CBS 122367 TaxID=1168545 RepID=A0A6G1JK79_9PLEO|nr:hypothetical protein K458DRAFT_383652 [Lentithecium fluviatile CBS 122367]